MSEGDAGELQLRTETPADTEAVGTALAGVLSPGDIVLLGGELGAGKTTLTKGLAQALGVDDTVTSPTFTLVRPYQTKRGFELLHADLWRLEELQEVIDLALVEALDEGAVAIIEWGERAVPAILPEFLDVSIDYNEDGEAQRLISLVPVGSSWERRRDQLLKVCNDHARGLR